MKVAAFQKRLPRTSIPTSAISFRKFRILAWLSSRGVALLLLFPLSQYAFAEVTGDEDVRLSLAGAQDKLPVKVVEGQNFFLPKGNSPSTHIIEFASNFSHLPENETFTTMLGRAAGIETVDIFLYQTNKSRIAVVERYDRIESNGEYFRIHQEDFCQALGTHPKEKYQQEGGPNLKKCIDLIKNVCSIPAIELEKLILVL